MKHMAHIVYNSETGRIIQGHVLEVLGGLPENSVDCCITSPPYWGLRDYKIEPQVWDENHGPCEHEWGEEIISQANDSNRGTMEWTTGGDPATKVKGEKSHQGSFCQLCGAWRGSLGLEPTPELFVQHIVQVFREVRRVLKPTGVCFVNLGDSYANQGVKNPEQVGGFTGERIRMGGKGHGSGFMDSRPRSIPPGLKPKDLCGIPWRVAFALQADGWWLRSDIIWAKPNPMPESVTDRPTKSHEYIFLFTKSAKYFWNQDAIKEECNEQNIGRRRGTDSKVPNGSTDFLRTRSGLKNGQGRSYFTRNMRTVWTFATEPTPEAHFATFPQELVRRCILAGTSEKGCCPTCGKPWEPVVEKERSFQSGSGRSGNMPIGKNGPSLQGGGETLDIRRGPCVEATVTGWRPTCSCGEEKTVPAVVLDPFMGSGTTGIVAENLYRRWIGIELNPEYIAIAEKRLRAKANVDQIDWMKHQNICLSEEKGERNGTGNYQ